MLFIGFHPTLLNFKGKKGKIPLLLTNNSFTSDHWAGNLSLSRSCSLATECVKKQGHVWVKPTVWMESKSLLWEGKEDGKWLAPNPSLSWEDGLYGFVEFYGMERDSASRTSIIPTLQLGKVKRGQIICPRFPLQGSSRAGNKIKSPFCSSLVCTLQAQRQW